MIFLIIRYTFLQKQYIEKKIIYTIAVVELEMRIGD